MNNLQNPIKTEFTPSSLPKKKPLADSALQEPEEDPVALDPKIVEKVKEPDWRQEIYKFYFQYNMEKIDQVLAFQF